MNQCRRCAECKESEHHWLDDPLFDDEGNVLAEYTCKHCDALGNMCMHCEEEEDDYACPICGGEGIVRLGG